MQAMWSQHLPYAKEEMFALRFPFTTTEKIRMAVEDRSFENKEKISI